jgi:hypothetical protein
MQIVPLIVSEGINVLYIDNMSTLVLNDIEDGSLSPDFMALIKYSKKYNAFHKALQNEIPLEIFIEQLDLDDNNLNIVKGCLQDAPLKCVRFLSSIVYGP